MWVDSGDVKEDGLVEGGDLPIREKMGKILPHHTGHTVVAACVATQQLADTVVPHCESFALELLADEGMPWCVHHVFATQAADERQVVQGRETKAKAESNGCGEVRDDMERRGRLEPAPHLVPTGSETNKILIGAVVTVQKGAETNVVDLKREHPLFLCIFFFFVSSSFSPSPTTPNILWYLWERWAARDGGRERVCVMHRLLTRNAPSPLHTLVPAPFTESFRTDERPTRSVCARHAQACVLAQQLCAQAHPRMEHSRLAGPALDPRPATLQKVHQRDQSRLRPFLSLTLASTLSCPRKG